LADEGKKRDFETKPDNRPVEEKLLTIIFSGESRGLRMVIGVRPLICL